MNVIPPLNITPAMLTSSSVVETAPADYAGGTTYALDATSGVAGAAGLISVYRSLQNANTGHSPASSPTWWVHIGDTYQVYAGGSTYAQFDMVIDATEHWVYKSLTAGNVGNALTDTTKWQKIGRTNRYAMFDQYRNTATVVPGSLTFTLTPGVRIDSLALLGMVANLVTIAETNAGSTVFSYTLDLNTREVANWYEYAVRPFSTQPSLVLFDVPPYTTGVTTVTLTTTEGNVELGDCVIGLSEYIGDIQYDAESDALNFSTVTREFDGTVTEMVPRRNVPKTIQQIMLPKSLVNRVRNLRDALGGRPAVFAGLTDSGDGYFDAFLIKGFYRRWTVNAKHPVDAVSSLELEEI